MILLATGGTIAMKRDPRTGTALPALTGEDLLRGVPELGRLARIDVVDFANVPSDYMDPPRWQQLRTAVLHQLAREDVAGVVISHGTDTLEETAWFLDLTVRSDKPVVLVGAQRNASMADFDGPRNLLDAVRVCLSPHAIDRGVLVVLNGQINAAREVTKTHTSDVGSFQSGSFGLLGTVDEDRVTFARAPLRRLHLPVADSALPRVDIVAMHAGADGWLLTAAQALGAQGIVVQALGYGNVNSEMFEAIREAIKEGALVVVTSRSGQGRVQPVYGFVGGGRTLQGLGVIFADDLSAQKARILLMLALQAGLPGPEVQRLFDR
ncbi:asparaginase [Roseateles sp. YR242]|uniref:asparaginase n=1 Tax=Roseateles sp. YR242 TaxID=1855305 RepID=UPI002101A250|nr:asparaginase [Roseateles sp. YR242]